VTSIALGCLGVSAPASFAATAPSTFVTMVSDQGDWVGQGQPRLFHPGNGRVTLGGNAGYLTIGVSGGTLGDYYGFDIAAPPGEKLHPGLYTEVQRAPFREAGRPGLDISGDGRGCNEVGGRFDVKDILISPSGEVKWVWLTYEQHCENGVPALFGEIRFAVPGSSANPLVAPGHVWWPDVYRGRSGTAVPVNVANKGPNDLDLTAVSVTGLNKADFPIRLDECTGVVLGPGELCQVWMRFRPAVSGPRVASLLVTDSNGTKHKVALDGFGIPGRTRLTMHSDEGDYIGQGLDYDYRPANAVITATGTRSHVRFGIDAADGSWWDGDFEAPSGDILAPGDYANATRYPFNGTGAGLDLSGNGRGCNQLTGKFKVTSIAFTSNATLRRFGATFEQHCEGEVPALRGTFEYRVPFGDTTAPGRVSNLQLAREGGFVRASWTNPTDADFKATIVRYLTGTTAPADPNSGRLALAGAATSARIATAPGRAVSVAAFAVDSAGNFSRAAMATIPPG
jgi:hypothetical protein